MTVNQMRAWVREAYAGNGWEHKVDNMSDIQVQAVYFSLLERGMLDKKKQQPTQNKQKVEEFEPFIGSQISIF